MRIVYTALPLCALLGACGSGEPSRGADAPAALIEARANPVTAAANAPTGTPAAATQILKGNWVPVGDTCTPTGGVSETALWFSAADQYGGETISGAGWTCTFPREGVISGQEFSGTVSCGFGEGAEGSPRLSVAIGSGGRLDVNRQATEDTGIEGGGEIEGLSGAYKKCSQSLTSPY